MAVLNQKKLVLIPYWVQDSLRRNGMNLSDCLDLVKIRQVLSTSDLIAFLGLQNDEISRMVFPTKNNQYADCVGGLAWIWSASIPKTSDEKENSSFLWNTLAAACDDASVEKELTTRLFVADAMVDRYKEPFATYDLTPEVAGVVIYPGYFTTDTIQKYQHELIVSILKVFYVYSAYHEVCKTPFFKRYLELLAGHR